MYNKNGESDNFTADFSIRIDGIRTKTVNDLENVIKQVEWTLIGEESGQKFELPQKSDLDDPSTEGFIALQNLEEANVIAWIESDEVRISSTKRHIQHVLNAQVTQASLTNTSMPWSPTANVSVNSFV